MTGNANSFKSVVRPVVIPICSKASLTRIRISITQAKPEKEDNKLKEPKSSTLRQVTDVYPEGGKIDERTRDGLSELLSDNHSMTFL